MAESAQSNKVAVLIFGARAITESEAASHWAQDQIEALVETLPKGSWVLSGGARGPDTWAREIATLAGIKCVEYRLDGRRWINGNPTTERWADALPPGATDVEPRLWPKVRDQAMVERLASARAKGWDVRALGLGCHWSRTRGTAYTAELLENRGLPHPLRLCPSEYAPPETSDVDIVFVDLETTGTARYRCAILELAAVRTSPDGGKILDRFYRRLRPHPGARIEPVALEVNGVNLVEWNQTAEDPRLALGAFTQWLPSEYSFGGYNTNFDEGFLEAAYDRLHLDRPARRPRLIDVMDHARELHKQGTVSDMKLVTLRKHYGLPLDKAHTAAEDIEHTVTIYQRWRGVGPYAAASPEAMGQQVLSVCASGL